ncbi:hypothetical protein [Picosynechococcus sp. PCC 73109]|uniref:hypothetical protein n=1 Tax=Picosynechococcus sp. PCC 73109 TaxID=374982 RepID=UPI00074592FA|nr:hypothetical protein [Picosynechococcus sp. PCC 73109]AMA10220.1 hypothetical protein AWQ23_13315 [Picosynechococcus sp. PCC 73109]
MAQDDSLLRRWFPTFVGLFERLKPPTAGAAPTRGAAPAPTLVRRSPRPDGPFFLKGFEEAAFLSRDDLLLALQWSAPPSELDQYAATLQGTSPRRSPVVETEESDTDFFIRGLQNIETVDGLKNLDLVALLTWEEQGQTLREVDPDDYDLLDDLLDVADI